MNGYAPEAALVQGTDGNLYGTAAIGGDVFNPSCESGDGCGAIFNVTPAGSFTLVYTFGSKGTCDGDSCDGDTPHPLLQSTSGTFYGTTRVGGFSFYGSVYSLSTGLGPFVEVSPGGAKIGAAVIINSANLTGTTAVSFNGIAAQFKVYAKTVVLAEVPEGATTGYVTVDTPRGSLTSNVVFRVTP